MPTDAEIDSALDAVIVAARAHLALLRAGDRATEQQVARAYVALNNATVRYDDLLSEEYDEVTPWDVEYLEPEEGDQLEEAAAAPATVAEADSGSTTICVRQRRDFQVPDIAALIQLGTDQRLRNWSAHDPQYARSPVRTLGDAVYELVLSGDGSLAALDAYPELVPGNGVLLINAVADPLTFGDPVQTEDDEPFRLRPGDGLLYRLDEEIVEDPDSDDDGDDIDDLTDGDDDGIDVDAEDGDELAERLTAEAEDADGVSRR
jgi:hypothetical protein